MTSFVAQKWMGGSPLQKRPPFLNEDGIPNIDTAVCEDEHLSSSCPIMARSRNIPRNEIFRICLFRSRKPDAIILFVLFAATADSTSLASRFLCPSKRPTNMLERPLMSPNRNSVFILEMNCCMSLTTVFASFWRARPPGDEAYLLSAYMPFVYDVLAFKLSTMYWHLRSTAYAASPRPLSTVHHSLRLHQQLSFESFNMWILQNTSIHSDKCQLKYPCCSYYDSISRVTVKFIGKMT